MCYVMYFVCSTERVETRVHHFKNQEQEVSKNDYKNDVLRAGIRS
jgi:hypothetical protein